MACATKYYLFDALVLHLIFVTFVRSGLFAPLYSNNQGPQAKYTMKNHPYCNL